MVGKERLVVDVRSFLVVSLDFLLIEQRQLLKTR
jgi:hypothetical protein